MTDPESPVSSHTYRIGAVSRLTGVPADTLRVWERRYHVVTPLRSDSGTRLYGPDDVSRLTLIKRLVDRGDAIGSVAGLSLEQLHERIRGSDLPPQPPGSDRPCRVLVIGPALAERMRRETPLPDGVELVGLSIPGRAPSNLDLPDQSPDLAVLEYPTLHGDQVREVADLVARIGAARTVLVYGFASRATLERLEARRLILQRAPVDPSEVLRWCCGRTEATAEVGDEESGIDIARPIPPRRFSDGDLLRIAAASPTVRCECPHHLVDLVLALSAFETYSAECEDRSAEDAALHAYLHAATARARAVMEAALARVVDAEGIALAPPRSEP